MRKYETACTKVLLERLSEWFDITPEVTGEHVISGRRMRIDAILVPRFIESRPRLGLEIKAFEGRKVVSINDYARHLKQCVDYMLCRFDGALLDMILAYPGLCWGPTHSSLFENTRYVAIRLAAPFRVGELVWVPSNGFRIRVGDNTLWDSREGLTEAGKRYRWKQPS